MSLLMTNGVVAVTDKKYALCCYSSVADGRVLAEERITNRSTPPTQPSEFDTIRQQNSDLLFLFCPFCRRRRPPFRFKAVAGGVVATRTRQLLDDCLIPDGSRLIGVVWTCGIM